MQLVWLDLAIISLIALSILTGFFRGFVKELVALSVWVAAIWLGYNYAESFSPLLKSIIHEKNLRLAAAFTIILFATLIIGGIVNAVLGFIMKRTGLNSTDRALGMGFGLLRGIFIVALLMTAVKMTSLPYKQYAKKSMLYAQFTPIVDWLDKRIPDLINTTKTMKVSENKITNIPLTLKGTIESI